MESINVLLPEFIFNIINSEEGNYYLGIRKDRWYLFYSRIYIAQKRSIGKFDIGTRMNSDYIRMVLGGNTSIYNKEINKYLDISRSYQVGKRSKTYKFKSSLLLDVSEVKIKISDDVLLRRIERGYQSEWKEILDNLNIDINSRISGNDDESEFILRTSNVKVDKNFRTYNVFTKSKELRDNVNYKGESFVQLDISASHLSILPKLLPTEHRSNKDVLNYINIVKNGNIYTFLQNEVNLMLSSTNSTLKMFEYDKEGYKKFKLYVLMFLNSEPSKYFWVIEKVLMKNFPTILKFILMCKNINKSYISNLMMQEESYLLYKFYLQMKKKNKDLIIIPIHDAVMVVKSKSEYLYNEMCDFYNNELGYQINIKLK